MKLFLEALDREVDELHGNGVRIRFIGERHALSRANCRRAWRRPRSSPRAIAACKLQVAVGYGGRWDIVAGGAQARRASASVARCAGRHRRSGGSRAACAGDVPDPDLFIRTGGEQRISNFLLWNLAYTELHFCDALWPDSTCRSSRPRWRRSRGRERRFGLTPDQLRGQREAAGVLKQRVLTAVALVAILLGVMLGLPAVATIWLVTLLVLVGAWEWAGFIGDGGRVTRSVFTIAVAAAIAGRG